MANRKTYHVISGGDGGWRVKAEGGSRASSTYRNKADAIRSDRDLAQVTQLGG